MNGAADENDITLTIIRTADAKKLEVVLPLSTKLGELKEDLGSDDLFGPLLPDHQRLFFLGRELKSNRSLQKLGLDRFPKNRVLHLHVKKAPTTTSSSSKRQQQQRRNKNNNTRRPTRSAPTQQKVTVTQTSAGDVLEIHDDSDDEIIIEENPRDKRRRIS
mmetsp:Transcript_5380/g.12702  ORF Transcript_5380/g.12702 Transcript_5380/m.12702 type:complete len:161 (+) Transcript_5380:427-909(+)